ncbi:MAG: DUF3800 domain-containing protein [Chloroflexi bacterium]|nr:DUF3800 domain-containing protein [Chloroflexota bacterium]
MADAEAYHAEARTLLSAETIEPRQRPRTKKRKADERTTCYLFLDECGGHETNKIDSNFPVFCLNGLVVDQHQYVSQIAARWNGLEAKYFGSADERKHEPSIRGKSLKHWIARHNGDPVAFESTLNEVLEQTDYTLISTVILKEDHKIMFGGSPIDMFLPISQYHVALDFILERFVHYLHYQAADAMGVVIAERIGPKETAQLRHEYTRLQLEGTQFVSDSWFRYQLDENVWFGE